MESMAELQEKFEEMNRQKFSNVYDSEDASGSISPLPNVLRNGLAIVATCGFLSFFTALSLFIYLSYKLVVWQIAPPPTREDDFQVPDSPTKSDNNGFLVPDSHLCPQKDNDWDGPPVKGQPRKNSLAERARREPPNQFLILIYNLLFADIQQSIAFLLNVTWLSKNAVAVGTPICYAQGWFISTGDLASSVFLTGIAIHTYMGVVKRYRLPTWAFYSAIAMCWIFIYGLAILQVIITNNGKGAGGLYVRAGAWCWVNSAFQDLRLYLHYLWIFISLALTSIIYMAIFLSLRSHKRHSSTCSAHSSVSSYPNGAPGSPASSTLSFRKQLPPIPGHDCAQSEGMASAARHPAFLIYPLIYVVCTAPLAAGRIASMAGNDVSLAYFCFAGSAIACNGWLDVLLYATTRRTIVFSGEAPPSQDTGIETFAFMRTPPGRKFGNVVYVSGGADREEPKTWATWTRKAVVGRLGSLSNSDSAGTARLGMGSRSGSRLGDNASQDSLKGFGWGKGEVMGMAIQCDTVTSVVVEVEANDKAADNSSIKSGASGSGVVTPVMAPPVAAPGLGSRKGSIASNHSTRGPRAGGGGGGGGGDF